MFCQQQARGSSQILTYTLLKTQRVLLSATSKNGKPDPDLQAVQNPEHGLIRNKEGRPMGADLHPVQNPEYALVSNKQNRPARS